MHNYFEYAFDLSSFHCFVRITIVRRCKFASWNVAIVHGLRTKWCATNKIHTERHKTKMHKPYIELEQCVFTLFCVIWKLLFTFGIGAQFVCFFFTLLAWMLNNSMTITISTTIATMAISAFQQYYGYGFWNKINMSQKW